jgi:hypothetical protein
MGLLYKLHTIQKLGQQATPLPTFPPIDTHLEIRPEPESIINQRMDGRALTEVLVRWKGVALEDDTWETLWKLQHQYPYHVEKVL